MHQRKVNERSGASGSPVALSTVYIGHAGLKKKKVQIQDTLEQEKT